MFFFFFNDTATTEIYTLSLHDALPISSRQHDDKYARAYISCKPWQRRAPVAAPQHWKPAWRMSRGAARTRSEEHTSELQSRLHLVCRLLLEKKKQIYSSYYSQVNYTYY